MAKKKFNAEERRAIIKKLTKIANDRMKESWDKQRAAYRPSPEYQRVKMLLEQRNSIVKELKETHPATFDRWAFEEIAYQGYLNEIRDKEIEHLVERYKVNESDLDVEIILSGQDDPVDDLIERLLRGCLCK